MSVNVPQSRLGADKQRSPSLVESFPVVSLPARAVAAQTPLFLKLEAGFVSLSVFMLLRKRIVLLSALYHYWLSWFGEESLEGLCHRGTIWEIANRVPKNVANLVFSPLTNIGLDKHLVALFDRLMMPFSSLQLKVDLFNVCDWCHLLLCYFIYDHTCHTF